MKFEKTISNDVPDYAIVEPDDFVDMSVVSETPELRSIIQPKSITKSKEPEVVPDDTPITPFDKPIEPKIKQPELHPSSVVVVDVPEDVPIPVDFIEQVPVYPGCEKTKNNEDKRKCMSEKIAKLVQKHFDVNLAGELGLTGKQVIRTQFKIDKTGHVADIQIQAFHPKLKEEAERVINKIPEMTPGKQQNKNVGVIYSLPIVFDVQN